MTAYWSPTVYFVVKPYVNIPDIIMPTSKSFVEWNEIFFSFKKVFLLKSRIFYYFQFFEISLTKNKKSSDNSKVIMFSVKDSRTTFLKTDILRKFWKFNRIKGSAMLTFFGEIEKKSKVKKFLNQSSKKFLSSFFEFLGENSMLGLAHYLFTAFFLLFWESLKFSKPINRFGASKG